MRRFRELLRYSVVGGVNACTYLSLYSLMVVLGLPYGIAAVAAFPIPVALGYWLHEHWTFQRKEPTAGRLGAFLLLQSGALLGSLLILFILVDGLGMRPIPARLLTTPLAPIFVFVISKAFVFSKPPPAAAIRDFVP